jgi:hypothetical protein
MQIEVETVDKTGTFLGSLWDAKGNVSVALLENGLAKLHPMFSPERTTEGHLLVQAQARAKKQLLKVPMQSLIHFLLKHLFEAKIAIQVNSFTVRGYVHGGQGRSGNFMVNPTAFGGCNTIILPV